MMKPSGRSWAGCIRYAVLVGGVLSAACSRDAPRPSAGTPVAQSVASAAVLARVGGRTISVEDFTSAVSNLPGGERRLQRPGGARSELEQLIDVIAIEAESTRRGLQNDPEYRERAAAIRAQAAQQERELLTQLLLRTLAKEAQITDDELGADYERSKSRFLMGEVPRSFEEVRAQLEAERRSAKAAEALQQLVKAQRDALQVEVDESLLARLGPPAITPGARPVVRLGPPTPRAAPGPPKAAGH